MSVATSSTIWEQAVEHHLAGRLPQAQALYQQLLAHHAAHADALHMLGVLEYQQGNSVAGLEHLDRAIAIAPTVARYHGHRGLILGSLGRNDEALVTFHQALELDSQMPEVWNNLAGALWAKHDLPGAIAAYRQAIAVQPSSVASAVNLGLALTHTGEHVQALEAFEQANRLAPGDAAIVQHLAAAYNNHGAMLERQGNARQAIESFSKALALRPDLPEAHFNRGKALARLGRHDEAIAALEQALAAWPDVADAHNDLGIALFNRGRIDEAIASYRRALELEPAHAQAWNNLGSALRVGGKAGGAIAAYQRALELKPGDAEVWNNLGSVLDTRGELEQAHRALTKALEIRPRFSQAENNLGNTLKNLGELDAALAAYQRAVEIQPDNHEAQSNRLYTMHFHPAYPAERIHEEHARWNAAFAAALRPADARFANDRTSGRRLRVGYVGAAFRDHCQAFFIVPLWTHHDRQQVELIAYSDTAPTDAVTARLRGTCDEWHNIAGLPDHAVAERIRQDRIDILVDLSLHMTGNRLLVLARKPAPVQITWLGYPGTTGLKTIDYRLTDPYLDSPSAENDRLYSEQSYRLPHTFWCYDPLTAGPAANDLPALTTGRITFGCLNNFCKVNEGTLVLWARAMHAVPESKLLLLAPRESRERVIKVLGSAGIEAARVEFVDRASRARYLAYYHQIDVGLDTFPYNGHTTTLDSLWMGVPVITIVGQSPAGRAGWSQFNNLGLTHLAADNEDGFVRLAAELAGNTAELATLRASLRQRMRQSPLMDSTAFARAMETAFRTMWRAFASG